MSEFYLNFFGLACAAEKCAPVNKLPVAENKLPGALRLPRVFATLPRVFPANTDVRRKGYDGRYQTRRVVCYSYFLLHLLFSIVVNSMERVVC